MIAALAPLPEPPAALACSDAPMQPGTCVIAFIAPRPCRRRPGAPVARPVSGMVSRCYRGPLGWRVQLDPRSLRSPVPRPADFALGEVLRLSALEALPPAAAENPPSQNRQDAMAG